MGQIGRRKPKVRSRSEYGGMPFDGGDIPVQTLHAYAQSFVEGIRSGRA